MAELSRLRAIERDHAELLKWARERAVPYLNRYLTRGTIAEMVLNVMPACLKDVKP